MEMSLAEILEAAKARGAILTDDHVVLTPKPAGHFHAPGYFDKDRLLSSGRLLSAAARIIALRFVDHDISVVIGPTYGAVGLAAATACWLSRITGREVNWVFAQEKTGDGVKKGERVIGRYFPTIVAGQNGLVTEDVFASGGSAVATINAVNEVGGIVAGVAVICNRGGITAEQLGVPVLETLYDIPMVMHPEETCPQCADLVPINMMVGHGKEFYERHPQSSVPRGVLAL
ncbi:MAG: phosphoribosyltransferase [Candidatus Buchananbacteria bacterium]|nr:phosphoribosyltransferase [Candidatus Buchananbacteria bacterium]